MSFAQDNRLWLSFGTGAVRTSGAEENNLKGNGFNVEADAFLPFYGKGNFLLGGLLGGNYTRIANLSPDPGSAAGKYQVYGGAVTVDNETDGKTSGSVAGLLGLQAVLKAGSFSIAPSVNAGYLHFNQKGFTQTGNATMNNGQTEEMALVKMPEQSSKGLVWKPQLKVGYELTSNLMLFITSAYNLGPELQHTTQYLVPQGGFNDKNTYETSQLAKGTWESQTSTGRYRFANFNAGIVLGIGKKKQTNGGIGGMGKGGGAVSSSYAAGRLSMTPTSTRQTPNTSFGQKTTAIAANGPTNPLYEGKGTAGTNPLAGSAMAKPGSPIGGIVVKGGKNPGGNMLNLVSNENGEVDFMAIESGTYIFRLTSPEITMDTQGPAKHQRKGRTYTAGRKNEIPAAGMMASPGTPIGGIVVKGGKNPGGNMFSLSSNENGEVTFSVTEPGAYKLQITVPETAGKSISEKDVSAPKPGKSKQK